MPKRPAPNISLRYAGLIHEVGIIKARNGNGVLTFSTRMLLEDHVERERQKARLEHESLKAGWALLGAWIEDLKLAGQASRP